MRRVLRTELMATDSPVPPFTPFGAFGHRPSGSGTAGAGVHPDEFRIADNNPPDLTGYFPRSADRHDGRGSARLADDITGVEQSGCRGQGRSARGLELGADLGA